MSKLYSVGWEDDRQPLSSQTASVDVATCPLPRLDSAMWIDASQGSQRLPVKVVPVPALNGAAVPNPTNLAFLKGYVQHPSQYDTDEESKTAKLRPANIASERDTDAFLDGEDDRDQQLARYFAERDLSGRFSVSTFGSGSTRSTFYRDSPSPPTRTSVRQVSATKPRAPPNKLRFDNDSSDDEAEEPSPASAVSYKTANEPLSSYETVPSASDHSQRRGTRSRQRFGDSASGTRPGTCSMASNDYVLVRGSRKRGSNSTHSFDLLGSMPQKMRKMRVREAQSNATVAASVADAVPRNVLSEVHANASESTLFEEIRGQPHGYTFTKTHLGSGNFGVVNVAFREYAVKEVNGKDTEAVRQCAERVALLRRVSHEPLAHNCPPPHKYAARLHRHEFYVILNIIRMKKAFRDVDNDLYYVVMDKMEGSVADLIQHNRGYLAEEHALVILRSTAKALDYLHKLGFVHRDVKSDNVLVARNCEVKLADLDSAAAENARMNCIAGTPHWVAPEMARIVCRLSKAPYTAKVDVWSFAIFATEFALGGPPDFAGEQQDNANVCGTICNPMYVGCVNDMVRAAKCPDVARLVEYCLKANPTERPRMSDVLALMSSMPEPDPHVLLKSIQRMVQRRAAGPNSTSLEFVEEAVQSPSPYNSAEETRYYSAEEPKNAELQPANIASEAGTAASERAEAERFLKEQERLQERQTRRKKPATTEGRQDGADSEDSHRTVGDASTDEEPQEEDEEPVANKHRRAPRYSCDVCGYSTPCKAHLTRHVRTHTGDKPFECAECGRSFAQKGQVVEHLRTHTKEKPYRCKNCDYSAATSSNLDQHNRRKHTGEKPHAGHYKKCGYRAVQKSDLDRHLRTHTGERPYKCPHCDFDAANKRNVTRHVKLVHENRKH